MAEFVSWWYKRRENILDFMMPILAVLTGFLVAAIMIKATGKSPLEAYKLLFQGALGHNWQEFLSLSLAGEGLLKGSILALTGLSVTVAFKAGLFNIGAEGQFLVGAITAAYFGFKLNFPPWINIPLILLAVIVFSGLYGALAAYLKVKKGVHEVITTIMLNWTAVHLIENWLVVGPFNILRFFPRAIRAGTPYVNDNSRLMPLMEGTRLNASIIIALIAVVFVFYLLYKTVIGYEIQSIGKNVEAARYSGINTGKSMILAMFISGALAGLAGACMILGTEKQYPGVFRPGYGFDGIAMALIGLTNPIGTFITSIFFGFVRAGATSMQLMGIHKTFADIIQGTAILFVASQVGFRYLVYLLEEKLKRKRHSVISEEPK